MHPLDRLRPDLRDLALARGGVVARRELVAAGMTPGAVRVLTRSAAVVHPGVYDLLSPAAAAREMPLPARAWAAQLHAGAPSAVGGQAALALLATRTEPPDVVEVVVPHTRQVRAAPGVRVRRVRHRVETTTRGGLVLLTAAEAAVDLARSPRDAVHWTTLVTQQGVTTAERVRARLDARARHPQRALLEGLLADIADGSTTVLEIEFRRSVLVRHGLPLGRWQLPVPGRRRRADIGYEAERLLVELDSIAHHSGPARYADLDRDNEHLLDGYATLRFGWLQATSGACASAARLRDGLRARGGDPTFPRCPACA